MSVYNKAKIAAKQGKLDPKRVNRAFGILQSKQGIDSIDPNYHASVNSCGCPDSLRGNVCKHRIAHMMTRRIWERENPYPFTKAGNDYIAAIQNFGSYIVLVIDSLYTWDTVKSQYAGQKLVRVNEAQGRRQRPDIVVDFIKASL